MSMTLNERNPNVDNIHLGSVGATTTVTLPGLYFRKRARIKNVYVIDQAGIALSGTNHVIVTLQDNAGSPVSYASIDTQFAAAVALTPLPMSLSSTDVTGENPSAPLSQQEADIPAGTMLNVKCQTLGTAVLTSAALVIEWYPL